MRERERGGKKSEKRRASVSLFQFDGWRRTFQKIKRDRARIPPRIYVCPELFATASFSKAVLCVPFTVCMSLYHFPSWTTGCATFLLPMTRSKSPPLWLTAIHSLLRNKTSCHHLTHLFHKFLDKLNRKFASGAYESSSKYRG